MGCVKSKGYGDAVTISQVGWPSTPTKPRPALRFGEEEIGTTRQSHSSKMFRERAQKENNTLTVSSTVAYNVRERLDDEDSVSDSEEEQVTRRLPSVSRRKSKKHSDEASSRISEASRISGDGDLEESDPESRSNRKSTSRKSTSRKSMARKSLSVKHEPIPYSPSEKTFQGKTFDGGFKSHKSVLSESDAVQRSSNGSLPRINSDGPLGKSWERVQAVMARRSSAHESMVQQRASRG